MNMRLDQDATARKQGVEEDNRRNEKDDDIEARKVFFCPDLP